MRELMLELLTWAPFEKLVLGEKEYIDEILSGNYQQPQSKFHDLFSGFCYYVEQGNANQKKFKDIEWLQRWKSTYCQNQNYTHSTKDDRNRYPLLFKKICFYVIVRGEFTDKEFMAQIGLSVNRISKWGISTRFRRYAEADTYSVIGSFRNGVKKPYIVSLVKKLYYEAGRQVSHSILLKDLPTFVDVFAGTASVAASVVSDGCPPPIVNDFDPLMMCFVWAFTYHQKELRSKIADLHNWLMNLDFNSTNWRYGETAYENHYGFMNSIMRLKPDEYWGDKVKNYWEKEMRTNPKFWESFALPIVMHSLGIKCSDSEIAENKQKAQRYKEFIIRIRSLYLAAKAEMDSCDRDKLRKIDFNTLSKNKIDSRVDTIIEYALAVFQFYSFKPGGKNIFHVSSVDERNYFAYLDRLKDDSSAVKSEDQEAEADNTSAVKNEDQKAEIDNLLTLPLEASSLTLESEGSFSRHLKNAEFHCKDFKEILPDGPSDKIYYLDSPYFLTTEYDVKFSDDAHKRMLDTLRKAKFKWIFSMQYNPSLRDWRTDGRNRRKQPHIIRDYGAYYKGFYAPLQAETPEHAPSNLFVILFDFDEVQKKWPDMKGTRTREMLVVNFNCLATIPLHDTAVVLPFDEFLRCADAVKPYTKAIEKADKKADKSYQEIVQRAIAWRKSYIENNYTGKDTV